MYDCSNSNSVLTTSTDYCTNVDGLCVIRDTCLSTICPQPPDLTGRALRCASISVRLVVLCRSIGYFIEGILCFLPFAKKSVRATFTGITNDNLDLSADTLSRVTMPLLTKLFGLDGLELKVKARGAPPLGGGRLVLSCPIVRELRSVDFCEEGFVKRIRGVAYCTKVSPQTANRVVDSARGLLNEFIPDVYIYTDSYKGNESGKSAGFGCTLIAESTSGCLISVERCADAPSSMPHADRGAGGGGVSALTATTPEDLGSAVSELLCEELAGGGCIDSNHASLVLSFMVLTPEDVSRVRLSGHLTNRTVATLRLLRDFFGTTFRLRQEDKTTVSATSQGGGSVNSVVASCLGVGYRNYAKKVT